MASHEPRTVNESSRKSVLDNDEKEPYVFRWCEQARTFDKKEPNGPASPLAHDCLCKAASTRMYSLLM